MSAPERDSTPGPLETLASFPDQVPDDVLQKVLALAVRAYAQRVSQLSPGDRPAPFASPDAVTPTDVVIAVTEMLRSVDVEVFELGMWQAWGNM